MVQEESNSLAGEEIQLQKLDQVLAQVRHSLETGRQEIYDIADDCRKQCEIMQTRMEESNLETARLIDMVDSYEKMDRMARHRLMEVSSNFKRYSEEYIKSTYEKAQTTQNELIWLRQQELFQRKKREELSRQLKQYQEIARKADNYLQSTGLALKILEANLTSILDTMEEAIRRQNMGLWIVESLEAERRKISRELHDGPAQSIAGMLIRLDLVKYIFEEDSDRAMEELSSIRDMGRESLDDLRRIMFDLKPSAVQEVGLIATLKEYFEAYENKYDFEIEFVSFGQVKKYDLSLEIALFRVVQEAITNVRKHAGVKKAMVKLEAIPSGLNIVIKDRGKGFDVNEQAGFGQESYGILGMRERAELLGGKISIISRPGAGTQVIVEVPTEGEEQIG
ncbi:Sensor DegS [Syntrophomonas zehnderi OL-4]|uniref:histidine kinase n=1 Tax=Syntrophomonas zehnderi OL-4 TaxID=690567 RepID=A0A0E4G9C8_9FIRM|nr:sensor histidine kinase [Syntrophomonas zehnderi]CFX12186.1 Sensor DegS [Syntrophomonas zehnderi OL-4]